MSWRFNVCEPCCGCCGSSAIEWDCAVGNLLTSGTDIVGNAFFRSPCTILNGTVTFKMGAVCQASLGTYEMLCDNENYNCQQTGAIAQIAAACQAFAEQATLCSIGCDGQISLLMQFGINDQDTTFNTAVAAQGSCPPPSFSAIAGQQVASLSKCVMSLAITITQFYKGTPCYSYYGRHTFAKGGLSANDFLSPVTLPLVDSVDLGALSPSNCIDRFSGQILGTTDLPPCQGPHWPASVVATPVFA